MSNCLPIILMIGSWVTFRGFPSKFLKCCFHRCIQSCWLVAFSLALAVLFLLLTLFIICHAIQDCLFSIDSLILLIWSSITGAHNHIVLSHIQDTHWRSLTLLQRCSQYILQPQPTGLTVKKFNPLKDFKTEKQVNIFKRILKHFHT